MQIKTIAIANDHAGTAYKKEIVRMLQQKGYEVLNFGTDDDSSVDYPDFIHPAAQAVSKGEAQMGIVLCGSGNGAQLSANKHRNVRAALCWNNELVQLARQHNDANILSIPARFVSLHQALSFVKIFLTTEFERGRHTRRVEKIHSGGDCT